MSYMIYIIFDVYIWYIYIYIYIYIPAENDVIDK